jgi:hypothetical protein
MQRSVFFIAAVFTSALPFCGLARAGERVVANPDELTAALEAAQPGDEIVLKPGTYNGGLYRENLNGVTIRSADVKKPAVIDGSDFGMQLSDPVDVVIANLVFRNQGQNGLNIDDGGSYETPATGITLIGITVKDIQEEGNHDGIKMAGVQNFLIDGVTVENWGTGGSAIDFVGCHHGVVQNSFLKHDHLEVGGSGIRPKGGSKDIVLRANRVELPAGMGRALQAGGSTDAEYFRFADGEADYEASEISIEGNVMIGGSSAVSWVNIDGGIVHHNVISRPGTWVMRILNENEGSSIVPTRNGQFVDNEIAFNGPGDKFNRAVNEGDAVESGTFQFARNRWYNLANPKASRPKLPTEETDGVYGEEPVQSTSAPQVWDFPWGKWIVNANPEWMSVEIEGYEALQAAVPGKDSKFQPLEDDPLSGEWSTLDLKAGSAKLQPMSQLILINSDACADCAAN